MTSWVRDFFIVGTFAFCGTGWTAVAPPEVIETYGDSVSAGFLSATSHTVPPSLEEVGHIWSDLFTYLANGDKTRFQKLHSPDLAWPNVLKDTWGSKYILNRAVTRALAKDMEEQIVQSPTVKKDVPLAAFIFIGHNDICKSQLDLEGFEKKYYDEMQKAVTAWDARHSSATLYLLPTGDMDRIYKLLEGSVWHKTSALTLTCNDAWDKYFPFCSENIKRRRDGTLSELMVNRVKTVRKVLARLAQEWNRDSKRQNKFAFLEDVATAEYKREYFAVDCYHLSKVGQKMMADDVLRQIQK